MDIIYPIAFLASLTGLTSWFLFQDNKAVSRRASAVFMIGFLTYLVALSMASASFEYKLLVLFRDLLVIGIVSQLFNVLRSSILAAIGLTVIAGAILYFSYFNTLLTTFPQLRVATLDTSGELLVRVSPHRLSDPGGQLARICNCEVTQAFSPSAKDRTDLDDYFLLDIKESRASAVRKVYRKLRSKHFVSWVEPNEKVMIGLPEESDSVQRKKSGAVVNDPDIGRQWGFLPLGINDLHSLLLRDNIKPVKRARIAIIDSGVDGSHEDLNSNYTSFNKSYDSDPLGHGTHCAGIAGAVSNNGIGIASQAPSSEYITITGYKAVNAFGGGSQRDVIKAMLEAVDNGADVLSMSLGGMAHWKKEKAYTEAVEYATSHGAVVVVAAGNNNANARTITPANVKGVIAVSAVDENLGKAFFSNTVQDIEMAVTAPGTNVYSTYPGNSYKAFNGTSMAAPYVAGLVGIMKSLAPELTTQEIFHILDNTGKETTSGEQTGKLVQPLTAVQAVLSATR